MWIQKCCKSSVQLEELLSLPEQCGMVPQLPNNHEKAEHNPKGKNGMIMRCIKSKTSCTSNVKIESDYDLQSSFEENVCRKVSVKEVFAATDNLHQKIFIGEGTAGKVYQGVLSNKKQVAVKHIIIDGYADTFYREIKSLSHIKHPNLVLLHGYCEKEDQLFLIYELCPYGNLSQWIFGKDKNLSWIQRLYIAVDSARGLWFLHTFPKGCIVHCDIKPTNTLIGKNFEAKLSDFGLSEIIDIGKSHVSPEVRGTFGYVDPEYQANDQVNPSGDVYSFGIVLLQIISGRKVVNIDMEKPMPLNKMARSMSKNRNSVVGFADPKLNGEYSTEAFDRVFKLALLCTSARQIRPSMEQVVLTLEEAFRISINATSSSPDSSSMTTNE